MQAGPGVEDKRRIPIASLNQYCFCPRRCALIHLEAEFRENVATLEGRHEHSRSDVPESEWIDGMRIERALPLWSDRLGLVGKADVVEFPGGIPFPVDHKRGRRRKWDNDDVQVCAQGLCLEEMLGVECPRGAVYHFRSRRRRVVELTGDLRELTVSLIHQVRLLLDRGRTPPAVLHARCDGCSLRGVCLPEITTRPADAWARWKESCALEDFQS